MAEVIHVLSYVKKFTQRRTGWRALPSGGSVPIYEQVTPYWRWYCSCGTVGGRAASEDLARADHAQRHIKEHSP